METVWQCPLCQQSLHYTPRQFTCANRHSFDQAKEGYVNLLPVNRKHSADPGDDRAMLESRRVFLERGFYNPLADALSTLIQAHHTEGTQLVVYDAGCGEGYYLNRITQQLGCATGIGTDISRSAMRMAAKHYPHLQFAVASSFDLPLADESVDVCIRIFAPASTDEITRILKPNGIYLWAYPAPQHLWELRQRIYDTPKPHTVERLAPLTGLEALPDTRVQYEVRLNDSSAISALLHMTPYYWSASETKQQQCQALSALSLTVDFQISAWRKC